MPSTQTGKPTYIYALCDPTANTVRYIGKADDVVARLRAHRSLARTKPRNHLHSWLRGLEARGLCPELVIIEERTQEDWIEAEQFWIAYFKYLGCNLTNHSGGGDGHGGVIVTDETKKRLSKAHKGRKLSPERVAKMKERALRGAACRFSKERMTPDEREVALKNAVAKNAKTYVLTSPDGEEMTITNLKKFCRENGLSAVSFFCILRGDAKQTQGWKIRRVNHPAPVSRHQAIGKSTVKPYLVTSPSGEQEKIVNLREWCLKHGFNPSGFHAVLVGSQTQTHGGWRIKRLAPKQSSGPRKRRVNCGSV